MVYKALFKCVFLFLVFSAFAEETQPDQEMWAKWMEIGGANIGYSLESLLAIPKDEVDQLEDLTRFCVEQKECHLLDIALEKYPLVISHSDDSMDLLDSEPEGETPEATDSPVETLFGEDTRGSRLRRDLGYRPEWANHETHKCASEGHYCSCTGNVVYTKRFPFGCIRCRTMSWQTVISGRYTSRHKANVVGGVHCSNGNFGDPWPGHKKQCFCHPRQVQKTRFDYLRMWTKRKCHSVCGNKGKGLFFC